MDMTTIGRQIAALRKEKGVKQEELANRVGVSVQAVSKIADSQLAFFEGIDYPALFTDFAERDVFDACVMLHCRQEKKAFTSGLLVKTLGLEQERAQEAIDTLKKYRLIEKTVIELDDEMQTVYKFNPTPSFVAFLIFAREMIAALSCFNCMYQDRNKPYFNE